MRLYKREDIPAAIVRVGEDAEKLQEKIHRLAISLMVEWAKDRTYGPEAAAHITELANKSPYHGRAFATWVQDMTPFTWSEEKSVFFVHKDQKLGEDTLNAVRKGKTFYQYKPAGQVKPLNDLEELEKLVKRVQKRQEKPVEGDEIHTQMWRDIVSLLNTVKASAA